jgi:hypothetical protein
MEVRVIGSTLDAYQQVAHKARKNALQSTFKCIFIKE